MQGESLSGDCIQTTAYIDENTSQSKHTRKPKLATNVAIHLKWGCYVLVSGCNLEMCDVQGVRVMFQKVLEF